MPLPVITPPPWKRLLRQNFTNWEALIDFLQLSTSNIQKAIPSKHFPLNLPRRIAEKIEKGNLQDPILLQFLPSLKEKEKLSLFSQDPVGDHAANKEGKLLHKYHGRALLLTTSACAMHCRYCFRQHYPYETAKSDLQKELAYLAQDASIEEIILSGGDPLSLDNKRLGHLIEDLEAIPHIKRLRFHSRFPIGIPERIDSDFLELLKNSRFQIWFVTHCNHPTELDNEILAHLKEIQKLGIPVINQSVLLKGVNDNAATLSKLSKIFINSGITPYYLHQLDRVEGAHHFEVSSEIGKALIRELAKELPGYALPQYVQEIEGRPHKDPI